MASENNVIITAKWDRGPQGVIEKNDDVVINTPKIPIGPKIQPPPSPTNSKIANVIAALLLTPGPGGSVTKVLKRLEHWKLWFGWYSSLPGPKYESLPLKMTRSPPPPPPQKCLSLGGSPIPLKTQIKGHYAQTQTSGYHTLKTGVVLRFA